MNEAGEQSKTRKRGFEARLGGGLLMLVGVVLSAVAGGFTPLAALFFFGGLVGLIVGIAKRNADR